MRFWVYQRFFRRIVMCWCLMLGFNLRGVVEIICELDSSLVWVLQCYIITDLALAAVEYPVLCWCNICLFHFVIVFICYNYIRFILSHSNLLFHNIYWWLFNSTLTRAFILLWTHLQTYIILIFFLLLNFGWIGLCKWDIVFLLLILRIDF